MGRAFGRMQPTNEKKRKLKSTPDPTRRLGVAAALVFLAAMVLYWLTLAPTVTLVDSGELILAAHRLGVAHPPGFPLYVILAHLATLVPIGNVAQRVHFASALFAASSAALLTMLMGELVLTQASLARAGRRDKKKGANKAEPLIEMDGETGLLASAVAAGLFLASSRTLWSYATIAEVYTLNTLLVVVVFYLMFRWRRLAVTAEQPKQKPGQPRPHDRWLFAAALVFGLSLSVHHVTSGLTLPALAMLVYSTEGVAFFRSKRFLYTTLFALGGLTMYLYLPIAASASPLFNWGDPSTIQRLWSHVTGWQYQVYLSSAENVVLDQAEQFARLVWREFGLSLIPFGIASALVGLTAVFKRDRTLFYFIVFIAVGNLAYTLNYKIAEDKDAYYLPVFVTLALSVGYGAYWGIAAAERRPGFAPIAVTAAVVAVPVIAVVGNFQYNNRSDYFIAKNYVENICGTIDNGGMVLTLDWQVYSPMLYMREVEGYRTDITGIDVNLLRRSWYFDYLKVAYPQLMEATNTEVGDFLEDLRNWERDPIVYEGDVALNRRISSRYIEMLRAVVAYHLRTRKVYVTEDIGAGLDPQNRDFTNELNSTYQLVPQGLAFEVTRDRLFHDPAEPELQLRGLVDGSLKFDDNDVVREKVLRVYTAMLTNRGRYLATFGRHDRAIRAFETALILDDDFRPAQVGLSESRNTLQRNAK